MERLNRNSGLREDRRSEAALLFEQRSEQVLDIDLLVAITGQLSDCAERIASCSFSVKRLMSMTLLWPR